MVGHVSGFAGCEPIVCRDDVMCTCRLSFLGYELQVFSCRGIFILRAGLLGGDLRAKHC